jgi:hypothetical protein
MAMFVQDGVSPEEQTFGLVKGFTLLVRNKYRYIQGGAYCFCRHACKQFLQILGCEHNF